VTYAPIEPWSFCPSRNSAGSPVGDPLAAWPQASACWAPEGLFTAVGERATLSVRRPARTAVTQDALTPGVTAAAAGRGMVRDA
jgi:hypothetical protein